jgi:hypothetical protein
VLQSATGGSCCSSACSGQQSGCAGLGDKEESCTVGTTCTSACGS